MRFSLIIPVYNGEAFIAKTLETVYRQTAPPDEVIIVNDGSNDNSVEVINSWIEGKDWGDRVQVISQDNQGASVARNTGIQAAKGDIVSFLDADDRLRKHHFALARAFFRKNPKVAWFTTSSLCDYGTHLETVTPPRFVLRSVGGGFYLADYCFSSLFNRYYVNTDSVFLKREKLLEIPLMDPDLKVGEDQDLWFRYSLKHPKLGVSGKITVTYQRFQNPDSLMNATREGENRDCKIRCVNKWLERTAELDGKLQRTFAYLYISRWAFPPTVIKSTVDKSARKGYTRALKLKRFFDLFGQVRYLLFLKDRK